MVIRVIQYQSQRAWIPWKEDEISQSAAPLLETEKSSKSPSKNPQGISEMLIKFSKQWILILIFQQKVSKRNGKQWSHSHHQNKTHGTIWKWQSNQENGELSVIFYLMKFKVMNSMKWIRMNWIATIIEGETNRSKKFEASEGTKVASSRWAHITNFNWEIST